MLGYLYEGEFLIRTAIFSTPTYWIQEIKIFASKIPKLCILGELHVFLVGDAQCIDQSSFEWSPFLTPPSSLNIQRIILTLNL